MQTNFLIIGSGISGLNFALNAGKKGQVILITKKKLIDSNTNYAQGGIAAVLGQTDDVQKHIADTLEAGAHHNNKKAVELMVKNSATAIYRLMDLGVEFAQENGKLKLAKEGGHNQRRIAYVGDYTGKEVESILVKRVKENQNIKILEDTFALKLIVGKIGEKKVCHGAQIIKKQRGKSSIETIFADQTIIATGGIGQLFKVTTNAVIATGDGIALGVEAGCKTKDLEFIQFHPTALARATFPRFLISEAVRGEGAKLVNSQGEYFMENRHPLKDLAPRDIVAREVYKELKTGPVYLDITDKSQKYLENRFPKIYAELQKYGYDLSKNKIPITPAMHYLCGGLVTDLHGQTNVKNLFAFGEVACTGVHGANRLASNSLLEALVFSNQIIKKLSKSLRGHNQKNFSKTIAQKLLPSSSPLTKLAKTAKKQIQEIMWKHAGILRNLNNIKNIAIPAILEILKTLSKIKGTNQQIAEAKNMAQVSLLILKAAHERKKSIGCHFVDHF